MNWKIKYNLFMNKKFCLIFFLIFLFSLFFNIKTNFNRINVPYFNGLNKKVSLDVSYKTSKKSEIYFDNKKLNKSQKIDENHYLYFLKDNRKINTISISNFENVDKIYLYNGFKMEKIKTNSFKIDNSKSKLTQIGIIFLSFFYNFQFYLSSYFFLVLFLYFFFKEEKPFKVNFKTIFFMILFLGIFLRLIQLNTIPFWDDEIFILTHCVNVSLKMAFQDAGNPPLFFILFKIWSFIFKKECFYRLLALVFGVLFNIVFYFYLKMFFKKQKALLGFFVVSINLALIYLSQEIRCYGLLILLNVLCSIFLFQFILKRKKKALLLYFITTLCFLYTHYWASFIVLFNFIFGSVLLFKRKAQFKNFIIVNLISFLLFIPEIILKRQSLTGDFNSWLKAPDFLDINLAIQTLMGNVLIFLLFLGLLFFCYKKAKKQDKILISYNAFLILFVFILATLFSYLIKPIFCYRYFYCVYPNCFILFIFLATFKFFKKQNYFLTFVLLILFTVFQRINYQNLFCNHNLFLDFIKNDIDKTKTNYVFLSDTVMNYLPFENQLKKDKVNFQYLPIGLGINTFSIKNLKLQKPYCIYLLNLYLDEYTLKNTNVELFKTNLGVFVKIEEK